MSGFALGTDIGMRIGEKEEEAHKAPAVAKAMAGRQEIKLYVRN